MSALNPVIADVVENGLCTGCGGCVAVLKRPDVRMEMSVDGFLRPTSAELSARERQALTATCGGLTVEHDLELQADYHALWGPLRRVATGYAVDPEVRHKGSSGGVLSALAIHLIESGVVDFVLSTAADPNDPIGTTAEARPDRSAVITSAGSRYAPSTPLANIETCLRDGRPFAFVGKPCDIVTLRRMAKSDPRIDALIPYKLAFFCAGVPSRKGSLAVLDQLGVSYEDLARFQYRGDGWPGLAKAERHDGEQFTIDYNSSWGTILNKHLQFRCKICPDGTGEFADIACADAWYGKDGYPDFEERAGRSLIVARTQKGIELLDQAISAKAIETEHLNIDEIAKMQPYQVSRKSNALARTMALWAAKQIGPRYWRMGLVSLALATPKIEQLRNLWGTLKRLPRRSGRRGSATQKA